MKTELAAVESIRRSVQGKPLIKSVKKLPPLYGKKKKPSSQKKLESKRSTSGGKPRQFENLEEAKYQQEISAARKQLGLSIPPPVKLD